MNDLIILICDRCGKTEFTEGLNNTDWPVTLQNYGICPECYKKIHFQEEETHSVL